MVGGPKGISLAKYVCTCFHILDLYVEYSRRCVVGQRTDLEDVAWSSTRKESNEFYIHEFLNHESCALIFVNFNPFEISKRYFFPFLFFSLSFPRIITIVTNTIKTGTKYKFFERLTFYLLLTKDRKLNEVLGNDTAMQNPCR